MIKRSILENFSAYSEKKIAEAIEKAMESPTTTVLETYSGMGMCFSLEDIHRDDEDGINNMLYLTLNNAFDMHPSNETVVLFFDIAYKLTIYWGCGGRSAPEFVGESTQYMRQRLINFNRESRILSLSLYDKYMGVIWGMTTTLIARFVSLVSSRLVSLYIPPRQRHVYSMFVKHFEAIDDFKGIGKPDWESYPISMSCHPHIEDKEKTAHQEPQNALCEKVFRFPSTLLKECLESIFKKIGPQKNIPSAAKLALMEKVLEDHEQLLESGGHKVFLKALTEWGLLPAMDEKCFERLWSAVKKKYSQLLKKGGVGYKDWPNNDKDRKTCMSIAACLHEDMKYVA